MTVRFPVEVYLALGADPFADPSTWSWTTDITTYAMIREGGVSIRRGKPDERGNAGPSSLTLLLNNADGRFSRLNPSGAYFGQLRKNTPIRVRLDPNNDGNWVTRFVGLVSEWPVSWDPSENDWPTRIRADGITRLLRQGRSVRSALRIANLAAAPLAYWPLEERSGATSGASGLPGGMPIQAIGPVRFGADAMVGSDASADLGDLGMLKGFVPISDTNEWRFECSFNLGTDSFDTNSNVDIWSRVANGTSLIWSPGHNASGSATLLAQTVAGGTVTLVLGESYSAADLFDGEDHHVAVTVRANGTGADWTWILDNVQIGSGTVALGLTKPVPPVERITISYDPGFLTPPSTQAVYRFSQMAFFDSVADTGVPQAAAGYPDELAGERFARILTTYGLTADVAGADRVPMGMQSSTDLLTNLRECETAAQGAMLERRTGELGLDLPSIRENAPVALALDYAQQHVAEPFGPKDDDLLTRNDITAVSATTAFFAQIVDDDSIAEVGRYDDTLSVNSPDEWLIHHAGWRLNLGTVNGYRWPSIQLKLHSDALASLRSAWAAADIGSRVTIDNLPANVSPDLVDLIIEGYTERFDNFAWLVTLNCAPYRPWRIAVAAADTCKLLVSRDTDDTSWTVVAEPPWSIDAADHPVDVRVGGERVTVTASSSAGAAAFVAAGTAAHGNNTSVQPGLPAGAAEGDLLLIFAAIRNSGTGTVNTPSGYTPLLSFGNMALFGKYHTGSESAPTVSFTGGVANADTSAQMCAFRRLSMVVHKSRTQLNGSAQDPESPTFVMRHDNCVVLRLVWKQDDWTSVAFNGTQIGQPSTATGDDQGIAWSYVIQTTAAHFPRNNAIFVITGGASAISRMAYVALVADVRTWTVTRSVNGVSASHAVGASIDLDPDVGGVMGL